MPYISFKKYLIHLSAQQPNTLYRLITADQSGSVCFPTAVQYVIAFMGSFLLVLELLLDNVRSLEVFYLHWQQEQDLL